MVKDLAYLPETLREVVDRVLPHGERSPDDIRAYLADHPLPAPVTEISGRIWPDRPEGTKEAVDLKLVRAAQVLVHSVQVRVDGDNVYLADTSSEGFSLPKSFKTVFKDKGIMLKRVFKLTARQHARGVEMVQNGFPDIDQRLDDPKATAANCEDEGRRLQGRRHNYSRHYKTLYDLLRTDWAGNVVLHRHVQRFGTGRPTPVGKADRDHTVPSKCGGMTVPSNLTFLQCRANRSVKNKRYLPQLHVDDFRVGLSIDQLDDIVDRFGENKALCTHILTAWLASYSAATWAEQREAQANPWSVIHRWYAGEVSKCDQKNDISEPTESSA